MKTVILAAGNGTRFKDQGIETPKPLVLLGGLTLLERTIRTVAKAGGDKFVIVAGDYIQQIKQTLEPRLKDLNVEWVHNTDWENGNGTSLLAAQPLLEKEDRFLVLMCDHLIFAPTIKKLIDFSQTENHSVMAIDKKRNAVYDELDATKVRLNNNLISEVHKQLDPFDGIDIGASVCTPDIFQELIDFQIKHHGACSHSGGMIGLANKNKLVAFDIGADLWEDADETESFKAAEKILFQSLRKETDGFLSRHLERYLSLSVTKVLVHYPIKPNHMTLLMIVLGFMAAYLFASPNHIANIWGALLFWSTSFLDGCDGEIARIKFLESRLGGWLDLWSDNLIHMMVFGGIGIGIYRITHHNIWIYLGLIAMLGVLLSVSWVSLKIIQQNKKNGPLFTSVVNNASEGSKNIISKFADALSRRDFIFWLIFITILGWQKYFLWMAAIGSIIYFATLILLDLMTNKNA